MKVQPELYYYTVGITILVLLVFALLKAVVASVRRILDREGGRRRLLTWCVSLLTLGIVVAGVCHHLYRQRSCREKVEATIASVTKDREHADNPVVEITFKGADSSKLVLTRQATLREIDLDCLGRTFQHLRRLDLPRYLECGDGAAEQLQQLRDLESLSLRGAKLTDAGIGFIATLSKLKSLELDATPLITDQGVESLASLTSLERLSLSATKITDRGVTALASLTNLEHLDLLTKRVTDDGIRCLGRLPRLKSLTLRDSEVLTDEAMKHLASFPTLQDLKIRSVAVHVRRDGAFAASALPRTDAGLKSLATSKTLRALHINSATITDAGLLYLSECPTLENLEVTTLIQVTNAGVTQSITEAGIHELKGRLPRLKVAPLSKVSVVRTTVPKGADQ